VSDVVGVSNAVLVEHTQQNLFVGARKHVIHNIIEQDMSADPAASQIPPVFGFLGRLTTEKGLEPLVEAYAAMNNPARLVIGGRAEKDLQKRLLMLAKGKSIDFLGFVKPVDFFRKIDVLVVPSIWQDPLPTVILEAQMAAKPTIGSRFGGIPEAIGDDTAGWTYDSETPGALTTLLDKVASDPQAIMAKAISAKAGSIRFHTSTIIKSYIDVYNRALNNPKRRKNT
jgi:glycosyltransferase involved in cell wall biosynthesis